MTKMRFVADFDGETHTVDVDNHGNDDGFYTMVLNGNSYHVDAQLMRSHIVSMLIDNKSYDVDIEKTGDLSDTLDGKMRVTVRGRVVDLDMLDERRRKMREAAHAHLGHHGGGAVVSPMPGKVIKLLVKEGDTVERGQGVVVVEAMKMENELKAPAAGTVKMIHAGEGDAVNANDPLVSIETD